MKQSVQAPPPKFSRFSSLWSNGWYQPACWLTLVIMAEVIFKVSPVQGIYAYVLIIILGSATLLMRHDVFISLILGLPLVRLASASMSSEDSYKLLLLLCMLGFYAATILLFSLGNIPGFSLAAVDRLLVENWKPLLGYIVAAVFVGLLMGLFFSWQGSNPSFSRVNLIVAIIGAIVFEMYFRSALLLQHASLSTVLLVAALMGAMVFTGSWIVALCFFLYNVFAGLVYLRSKTVYLPLIAGLALQTLPVIL
jgi:hypothetical protein